MLGYVLRRFAIAIPLLLIVIAVMFLMLRMAPGDPITAIVGNYPVPESYRAELVEKYRLDDPLWLQFLAYLGALVQGDFGYSFAANAPVFDVILSRLAPTLMLVLPGIFLGCIFGITAGVIGGRTKRSSVDGAITTFILVAYSLPSFWLSQLMILLFALNLRWFPTSGLNSPGKLTGWEFMLDTGWHLVLPVLTLAIIETSAIARVMRASTAEVSSMDYIVSAEMKGLSNSLITRRHVIRNASLPVISVLGVRLGSALAGVLLIETVFGYPGMGSLLQRSLLSRDNGTIIGIVIMIAVVVIIANLITDIIYSFVDPRIRRS